MPHGLRPLLSCSLFSVVSPRRAPPRARRRRRAHSEWRLFRICASLVQFYLFDGSKGGKTPSEEDGELSGWPFRLHLIMDIHPRVRSGQLNGAQTRDTVQCSGPFPSHSHFLQVA